MTEIKIGPSMSEVPEPKEEYRKSVGTIDNSKLGDPRLQKLFDEKKITVEAPNESLLVESETRPGDTPMLDVFLIKEISPKERQELVDTIIRINTGS